MKQLILFFLFSFFSLSASAQNIKLDDILEMKAGKLIVGLTGNDTIDTYFKNAIEKYWTYKEIAEYLPVEDAVKLAKKDKGLFVLYLGSGSSVGPTQGSGTAYRYKTISSSRRVKITTGKNWAKPEVYSYYPTYKDVHISQEALFFGVGAIEHICQTMEGDQIKSLMKWKSVFNKYSNELENKTVYLHENWLDDKLTEADIQETYPFPIKVVAADDWSDAILNHDKDIVYCIIVPTPMAGDYVYIHYFMSASEAKIMGTAYAKVNARIQGFNVTATNSGYIKKSNIKLYAKMVD